MYLIFLPERAIKKERQDERKVGIEHSFTDCRMGGESESAFLRQDRGWQPLVSPVKSGGGDEGRQAHEAQDS